MPVQFFEAPCSQRQGPGVAVLPTDRALGRRRQRRRTGRTAPLEGSTGSISLARGNWAKVWMAGPRLMAETAGETRRRVGDDILSVGKTAAAPRSRGRGRRGRGRCPRDEPPGTKAPRASGGTLALLRGGKSHGACRTAPAARRLPHGARAAYLHRYPPPRSVAAPRLLLTLQSQQIRPVSERR